ncbi:MAG: DUF1893 domain-containing protein [Enterocloster clostridioformis]
MGIMAGQIPIRECHAVKVSEGGLRLLNEEGVKSAYEEIIPLIKSSKDDNIICPIEQFLYEHKERQEQWRFLEARFKGEINPEAWKDNSIFKENDNRQRYG